MINRIVSYLIALVMMCGALAPVLASGQRMGTLERMLTQRQDKKNEWRNIAIASGALGLLGLLKKDNTLFFLGAGGALYSAWRYEQDRKSQSKMARLRASYFSRTSFTRDGRTYVRKTVWRNGKKYYQFVRA